MNLRRSYTRVPLEDAGTEVGVSMGRASRRGIAIRAGGNRAAFTLVELMISSAVMSMMLVGAYLCLRAGLAGQAMVQTRTEIVQNARVAMALMTADLRAACPLPGDAEFLGMNRKLGDVEADNLDFATHHFTPARPREGDFCEASYFLDKNTQGGFSLWRRRDPTPDAEPLAGGSREEIASGLRGLRFEYTDGFYWYDEWGDLEGKAGASYAAYDADNLYGMPEAVRITLLFESEPGRAEALSDDAEEKGAPPLIFQTVVCLNLSARSWSESSSSGSGTADEASSNGSGSGAQNPPAR